MSVPDRQRQHARRALLQLHRHVACSCSSPPSSLEVDQFPALSDNYGFLVHDAASGETAAIDAPDAAAVNDALRRRGWRLSAIWNTHWHPDHTGANEALKERHVGVIVYGPRDEAERIPALDVAVGGGDIVPLGGHSARCIDVRGHTAGHVAYYFEGASGVGTDMDAGAADADPAAATTPVPPPVPLLFAGDALFAMGCGRLFEGTPEQMLSSLRRLAALPARTRVYCAHEYTAGNARFALTVDPSNPVLVARAAAVREARARSPPAPTVPTTIGLERATNPFLRCDDRALRAALGAGGGGGQWEGAPSADVFAHVRDLKDHFSG